MYPLTDEAAKWKSRVRAFVQEELRPYEVEAEMNGGVIDETVRSGHRQRALALGLSRMDMPAAHGGLDLDVLTQVAVWEELGAVTNALGWCFSEPHRWMFEACTPDQLERYVLPLADGSKHECYAITEELPGSDVAAGIATTAVARDGGYIVNGVKWYVTSANFADFFVLQARFDGGPHHGAHGLFFVDIDSPGVELLRTPPFSHTYAAHHPEYRFRDVFVPAANLIGRPGDGMDYTRSWFRRERLMIAARCCGAATRLIEDATAFAQGRMIGGEPLAQKQVIQFMLADSLSELWSARLVTYEAAAAHDRDIDAKSLHLRCSIAKLQASEMANRVADRAVQIFGGRGYMRENVAERFFRELRVDRIWEGTSEIQRMIIAGALLKRGLNAL